MPRFGAESRAHRAELHPDLQRIVDIAIQHWDCKITDGARTIEEQRKNIARGVSQTMNSRHLPGPDGRSRAVDIVPYPIDWKAIQRGIDAVKRVDSGQQTLEAYVFSGFIQGIAAALGIPLRSGIDWDSDREFSEHSFIDLPHHELAR